MPAALATLPRSGIQRFPTLPEALSGLPRAAIQQAVLVPALRTWCAPFRVEGARALEQMDGPYVLVANHTSHLDAPAILAALPSRVREHTRVAAAEDYFYRNPLLGGAATLAIGTFPFPRHGGEGLQRAAALLARGENVLLFPEGTRSRTGQQQPFRDGVARLLLEAGVPVLPVGIVGAFALWPASARRPRRGPLSVRFGQPWRPEPGLAPRQVSSQLAERVAALTATSAPPAGFPR